MSLPKWSELKRFYEKDGWEPYKNADHYFYRKFMLDGQIKMTKVSRGSGEIKKHLWQEILKKQLQVTQEEFNSKI